MAFTFSDLESLVNFEMYELGYDFRNPLDVKLYWEKYFNGN